MCSINWKIICLVDNNYDKVNRVSGYHRSKYSQESSIVTDRNNTSQSLHADHTSMIVDRQQERQDRVFNVTRHIRQIPL